MEQNNFWHTKNTDQAFAQLKSGQTGISAKEAATRFEKYGPNEIQAAHRVSPWEILFEQFKNVLILILLGATALSFFLGHGVESIVIYNDDTYITRGGNTYITRGGNILVAHNNALGYPIALTAPLIDYELTAQERT